MSPATTPRCDVQVAKYRVTFRNLVQDPDTLEHVAGYAMKLQLPQHPWEGEGGAMDGSPLLDTAQPWEGLLCRHELAFLKGFPGKDFQYQMRFLVELLAEE